MNHDFSQSREDILESQSERRERADMQDPVLMPSTGTDGALFATPEDDALADHIRVIVDREKADYPDDSWVSFMHGFIRGLIYAGEMLGALRNDIETVSIRRQS